MTLELEAIQGWILGALEARVALWIWLGIVLAYGLFRSTARPAPDPLRQPGPFDL